MGTKKIIIIIGVIIVIAVAILLLLLNNPNKPKPDTLSTQCSLACQSGLKISFCDVERTLSKGATATCNQLSTDSQYSSYGVQSCPSISCTVSAQEAAHLADQTCVTGLGGTWQTPVNGICPQTGITAIRQLTPSDQPPVAGQICCR